MDSPVSFMRQALGRDLTSQEEELLHHLSPYGMSKLNNDVAKGIDLEQTLREFQTVFLGAQSRRRSAEAKLSDAAKRTISYMTRQPSPDEMAVLTQLPTDVLKEELQSRLNQGNILDDAIEDLTSEVHRNQMLFEARQLSTLKKVEVTASRLPSCSYSTNVLAPYAVDVRCGKMSVSLSPVVLWFHELATDENKATTRVYSAEAAPSKVICSTPLSPPTKPILKSQPRASSLPSGGLYPSPSCSGSLLSISSEGGRSTDSLSSNVSTNSSLGSSSVSSNLSSGKPRVRFSVSLNESDDDRSVRALGGLELPSPKTGSPVPLARKSSFPGAFKFLQGKVRSAFAIRQA